MPDITMCLGDGCKKKQDCYRFKAIPSEYQCYFSAPVSDTGVCEHFWELTADKKKTKKKTNGKL